MKLSKFINESCICIESILQWSHKWLRSGNLLIKFSINIHTIYYLFLFSEKPTTKLRNSVDQRSSLIQNSTILKHRNLGKTPQRIKWTWTSCLIFCQKRSLTPQHQVQDQSGQCCQFCFFKIANSMLEIGKTSCQYQF